MTLMSAKPDSLISSCGTKKNQLELLLKGNELSEGLLTEKIIQSPQ